MGTYRQPGIYVHKGFEQFNKAMAEGNKNFLAAYKQAQATQTANKKNNDKLLADARKQYQKWGDLINDTEKEHNFKFDADSQELLDAAGEEYFKLVGVNTKEAYDRITQLESFVEQLARMAEVGETVGKQFKDAYSIQQGAGRIDAERTPSVNLGYAGNIYLNKGNKIKPVEILDNNGVGTGVLVSRYYHDNGEKTDAAGQKYTDFDNNELFNLMSDKDNPYQFILTKGDINDVLKPYAQKAKGETTVLEDKKVKGNEWLSKTKPRVDVTYVQVDPSDPDYDPNLPYKQITTSTTQYASQQDKLALELGKVNFNHLMKTGDASWIFNDVINWARQRHIDEGLFDPADFSADDDAIDAEGDDLFYTENGEIQSIPWVMDPMSPTSNYPDATASQNARKLQEAMFKKYVDEYILDPENGFIPQDQTLETKTTYISKRQYEAFSKTPPKSTRGSGSSAVVTMLDYSNRPSPSYKLPRFPGKELTPYQFDRQSALDAMYVIDNSGSVPKLTTTRKTEPETMKSIVATLNDPNIVGTDYDPSGKSNKPVFIPEFYTKEGIAQKIQSRINALSGSTNPADIVQVNKYKKSLKKAQNSPENALYFTTPKGGHDMELIDVTTGDDDQIEIRIEDLFHRYNGILQSVRRSRHKMKKLP